MTLQLVTMLTEVSDFFSDAQNARVLGKRLEWAGIASTVQAVNAGESAPDSPDFVVLGGASDGDLREYAEMLRPYRGQLSDWLAAGVPMLAIGSGWALLGETLEMPDGGTAEGLGLVPVTSTMTERIADELVLKRGGEIMFGFQNSNRAFHGVETGFGKVVYGRGNEGGKKIEGQQFGSLYATVMQGPVCGKNPAFADELLQVVTARKGFEYTRGEGADFVDNAAKLARENILKKLNLQLTSAEQ
ncbi:MAG: hypothetical protein Q4C71_00030 [Microbacteriaceae bacterium]|nr:hypothetical protein [Microbacteriaceae bacterium]